MTQITAITPAEATAAAERCAPFLAGLPIPTLMEQYIQSGRAERDARRAGDADTARVFALNMAALESAIRERGGAEWADGVIADLRDAWAA